MDMHGTKASSTTAGVCHAESSSTVLSLGTVFCEMLSFYQLRELFALIVRPPDLQTPSTLTTTVMKHWLYFNLQWSVRYSEKMPKIYLP